MMLTRTKMSGRICPNPKNHTENSDYNPKKMLIFWIRIKIYVSLQSKMMGYGAD